MNIDIDQFPGLPDTKDTLVAFIKGEDYSGCLDLHSIDDKVIIEEMLLNDEGIVKNCLYQSKCTGVERNSVLVIVEVSLQIMS